MLDIYLKYSAKPATISLLRKLFSSPLNVSLPTKSIYPQRLFVPFVITGVSGSFVVGVALLPRNCLLNTDWSSCPIECAIRQSRTGHADPFRALLLFRSTTLSTDSLCPFLAYPPHRDFTPLFVSEIVCSPFLRMRLPVFIVTSLGALLVVRVPLACADNRTRSTDPLSRICLDFRKSAFAASLQFYRRDDRLLRRPL
jgi:hypothetical protein